MGDRVACRTARQHPDLTPLRPVVLTLLAIDGVLSAVAAAFFLPLRIGSVPFPISALISGLVNAALVWAALQWTTAPRIAEGLVVDVAVADEDVVGEAADETHGVPLW